MNNLIIKSNRNSIDTMKYRDDRMQRLSLLPTFPSLTENGVVVYNGREHLLLANIPESQLTEKQRNARRTNQRCLPYKIMNFDTENNHIQRKTSFLFNLHRILYVDLIERLDVDETIIDYNYNRLMKCLELLNFEKNNYKFNEDKSRISEHLNLHEYSTALEFYLQIDVDLFFMKTCQFRGAKPDSLSKNRTLFCQTEPRARYGMVPCQFNGCQLCFPKEDIVRIRQRSTPGRPTKYYEPVVKFLPQQKHRFVSGYEAILNCPVSCQTTFIIYTLTCPCQKFDYIGYTATTLQRRLYYHRLHGNRIMREFLLGQKNVQNLDETIKTQEDLIKDGMLLYRHSARCAVAMQWFLDLNRKFWSFVPMSRSDAEKENLVFVNAQLSLQNSTCSTIDSQNQCHQRDIENSMSNLPPLPNESYTFSNRQCAEQFELFRHGRESFNYNIDLDLYNAAIIAALPENSSIALQRLVESLFITHANTRLNLMGHIDDSMEKSDKNLHGMKGDVLIADRGDWCANLLRPN